MGRRVFVCYSKKDAEYRDLLVKHLSEDYEAWWDEKISPGQEWDAKIRAELESAAIAIVLVSADCLTTPYVKTEELPRLIAAHLRRDTLVVPLFVGAVDTAGKLVLPHDAPSHPGVDVAAIQGLNRPSEPLESLAPAERADVLRKASRTLRQLQLDHALPQAEGELLVEPCLQPRAHLRGTWGDRPLADVPLSGHLVGQPCDRATALVLGPERSLWNQLGLGASPLGAAIHVRVRTDDADLAALPWARTRHEGCELRDFGWSFALEHPDARRQAIVLERGADIACLASDRGRALGAGPHARSVGTEIERVFGRQPQLVSRARSDTKLRADLLYVFAKASAIDDQLRIELDDAEIGIEDLLSGALEQPPAVMVLVLVGNAVERLRTAARHIARHVPLLVVFAQHDPELARRSGVHLVRALLAATGASNVSQRIHKVAPDAIVWSRCLSLTVPEATGSIHELAAVFLLDRDKQRARVRTHADDLVRRPERRIAALVAHGSEGNHVDAFASQARTMLSLPDAPPYAFRRIEATLDDFASVDSLRGALHYWLEAPADNDAIPDHIDRIVPEPAEHDNRVLYLGWQVLHTEDEAVVRRAMKTWGDLHVTELVGWLPDRVQLLSLLTFESTIDHETMDDLGQAMQHELAVAALPVVLEVVAPPLDIVRRGELTTFLATTAPRFPKRDREFLGGFSNRLWDLTQGRFDELVQWIDRGIDEGWYQFEADL